MTSQTATAPRSSFISLRLKLLIGFTLLFSVVFAVAFLWFYTFATQSALNQIKDEMHKTLQGAIEGVDGDAFEALAKGGQADSSGVPSADPRYVAHQNWLGVVHQITPRANPYTYVQGPGDPLEVLWVGDILRIIRPEDGTKFLDSYTSTNGDLIRGFSQEFINVDKPYTDKWGYWVSGYAPIKNSQGQVVGAFGIDYNADYVLQVQAAIRRQVGIAFVITYSILFALVYLISRALTEPIRKLTHAAELIGEGHYEQDLSSLSRGRFPDEINTLAQVFSIMVSKVYQREQALRRQVEELRIEVDEAKRQKQVSEIVDTEFFQELQEKARVMRGRRRDKPSGETPGSEAG